MKKMSIEYLKITDIMPYENNPRHNDDAVDYVANSIKEFGFKVPIIIDQNNVIVAGHTRLKASEKLGLKEVPCIRANDLTEDQIKAFRIADNKVAEFSTWDMDKLDMELADIDIDMSGFGFDDIEEPEIEEDESDIEENEGTVTVKITFNSSDDWQSIEDKLRELVESANAEMAVMGG